MTTFDEAFITVLHDLDPFTLARLRNGEQAALDRVLAGVPGDTRAYAIVAALYPHNRQDGGHGSVGQAMRQATRPNHQAFVALMEKRFAALIDAQDLESIQRPLRYCIRRLVIDGVGIDWVRLLADLRRWEDHDREVRKTWAHDFWGQE